MRDEIIKSVKLNDGREIIAMKKENDNYQMLNHQQNPDIIKCVLFFNKLILDEMYKRSIDCWIAGGALRDYFLYRRIKSDIDIFFPSELDYNFAKLFFYDKEATLLYENKNAISFIYNNNEYNLIKIFHDVPESTLNSFDFTVCCCAVYRNILYYISSFFIDLSSKKLHLNKKNQLSNILIRLQKYIRKGFTIDKEDIFEIMHIINNMTSEEIEQDKFYDK